MFFGIRPAGSGGIAKYLIIFNIIVFILQTSLSGFTELFELTPIIAVGGAYWQFFTYMFLHGDLLHIFWNMFALYIFGTVLERQIGTRRFLYLYFASGVFSAVFHVVLSFMGIIPSSMTLAGAIPSIIIPMLGASGAVFGVLAAFAYVFPDVPIIIFPIPIPIKVKYGVIGFVIFSLVAGISNVLPGIAHFGHLGGLVAGLGIMYYWSKQSRRQRAPEFENLEFVWE